MMGLVSKLKGFLSAKIAWGAIIVLSTLLTVSHIEVRDKRDQVSQLTQLADRSIEQNKRLSDQLKDLQYELDTRPAKQIEVVKKVMIEMCEGKVLEAKINSIPSKREVKNVDQQTPDQKPVADIDDRLPDDLLKLLQ